MAEMRVTTLKALGAGSVFTYGGIRWIVLEQSGAAALVLAADLLPDEMPFDEEDRNDWAVSTLRQYLNGEFFKQLVEAGADADAFNEMVVDLTSDDGLDDYGTDRCKIALISDAQYRRFRRIIPNVDNWWWTVTPFSTAQNGYSRRARSVNSSGALRSSGARRGLCGVRPLCNLNSSILVSDTTDADGCYTITWNEPPTTPPTITPPDVVYSGRTARITWGASTDPDGDSITYRLERSYNNGAYSQVYSGTARTFDDTITTAMNTVRWRVKAVDSEGNESGYITTSTLSVVHNQPPEISGADGSLGVKTAAFSFAYTITDADGDAVSVVEAVDGRALKTYTPTLGEENRMEVSGNEWVRLAQGNHTLTVTATDTSNGTTIRTMSFVKNVDHCYFELADTEIMEMPQMPERMTINAICEVAAGAIFTVEVCNNAFDVSPTWEDATAAVLSGLAYVFTNKVKTASKWGVNIRARIDRNGAVGNCRIYGIGGYKE